VLGGVMDEALLEGGVSIPSWQAEPWSMLEEA